MKFVCADLPRPNLVEEDSYGDGGVKISAVGDEVEAVKLFLTGGDEVAAALGFGKLERERGVERRKSEVRRRQRYL